MGDEETEQTGVSHRREFLAVLGAAMSLGLAGCGQEGEERPTERITGTTAAGTATESKPPVWRDGQAIYTQIHSEDFEASPIPEVRFNNGAELTGEVIDGERSVKLTSWASIDTNPDALSLSPDTHYLFQFDYKILDRGATNKILEGFFLPKGSTSSEDTIHTRSMLANAPREGTFSTGALTTNSADSYYLKLQVNEGVSLVIDNLVITRLDPAPVSGVPDRWSTLSQLPFPRLGNYITGSPGSWPESNRVAPDWSDEFVYAEAEFEEKLSFFDVVAGPFVNVQSMDTSFVKRMRERNPDTVVVPYTNYILTNYYWPEPHATVDLEAEFYADLPDEWIMKHADGSAVEADGWPGLYLTNIYETCPEVGGQTYNEAVADYWLNTILNSGVWDGIMIDNVISKASHYIPAFSNPARFDYDVNRNGRRDETIANANELTRSAIVAFLQNLRDEVGDTELVIANSGFNLDYEIPSYLNGVIFELFNHPWYSGQSGTNELAWRRSLDDYRRAEETTLAPHLNILEAGGGSDVGSGPANRNYLEPTTADIEKHRFALGTALLGDGFYEYDLYANSSVPYWFDEYSVNADGVAVEDTQYKGYLGMPLGDPVELKSPATLIWEEGFDSGSLPSGMEGDAEVYVERGRMVIDNPDHTTYKPDGTAVETRSGEIPFAPGETHVIEFDWEIVETIDDVVRTSVRTDSGDVASVRLHGVFEGDTGSEHFHVTVPDGDGFRLKFSLQSGGGKVAIDDVKIYEGGAGPWRRDFENGFVLVNPINKAYTFSDAELAGDLDRTGIKRIQGSQAPEVNNGRPVTGSLTLQPFDAIILLANSIGAS
ncbi:putative glycoside hydrolase [Halanaeroarchaeum sulfurireducens]|uniref:Uncharacterized protein n=1 Tax=Halanaeroarchaeum sulfurireducens TaxID=1604004 RepID=A0A0F7PE56_9EURY|nr:putative glycoside hydrolase [Halanaeroarchaeum sulfurireducens]AKH97904.1 hypothetical protein HLASF_1421 [Halanaeroarchaeum sulfurireducens]